jgi:hypothetical protein
MPKTETLGFVPVLLVPEKSSIRRNICSLDDISLLDPCAPHRVQYILRKVRFE